MNNYHTTANHYERQFVTLTTDEAAEMNTKWKKCRTYYDAKQAFNSAARTEYRGISVAFAKVGMTYRVWVGEAN